ncbi:uncharacterized protein LOC108917406 [Anoplophora glabripennis]|uniref:uncharacterized protein LOC108917406 n=1 Tax=Anoplophora glabripennis TaxID=217634 RepID=UPI00087536B5|nr:uncharacterized protein LOC108917406 [Anoplophora glabripennis]
MVFGEIVEPSTRALIDEDLEEYPEYTESIPDWEGSTEPPGNIDTLIFIETGRVTGIFRNCVLGDQKANSKINNAGIEIFDITAHKYLVVFTEKKEFTCGEIVELLDRWIRAAKHIYTITSESIYSYQNVNLYEKPVSLVKALSNDANSKGFGYSLLEPPNLVTGLGASVLSYCVHIKLKCNLFVMYVDTSPLDSLNMGPLLHLIKKLDIPLKNTDVRLSPSSSNLYM